MNPSIFPPEKIIILDGAIGTELLRRGAPFNTCLEQWAVEHPDILYSIHTDYKRAGADILYTATFGSNRFRLTHFNLSEKAEELTLRLAEITGQVAGTDILVAGCIGPSGESDISEKNLVDGFKEQIAALLTAQVDVLVIETMTTVQEAAIILSLARSLTDKPVFVSMVFTREGTTLDGFSPDQMANKLLSLGVSGIGYNCMPCSEQMVANINLLAQATPSDFPLLAKPNAGQPKQQDGRLIYGCSAESFAQFGKTLASAGASLIGGCCGTTPEYIARLRKGLFSSQGD